MPDTSQQYIALIRGINVGKAKRIAMADLRDIVEALGGSNVRTLLNSGNVVFHAAKASCTSWGDQLSAAIMAKAGFTADVIVISAKDLQDAIAQEPFAGSATDPSRYLLAFAKDKTVLEKCKSLEAVPAYAGQIAVGKKAVYLWCKDGVLDSAASKAFTRLAGTVSTSRNWATALKLQAMLD
ncbi:DUF1697 domain-containing protein [Undibacterium sp. TJN19]|uniref:DUF1697 domain-containing protein n=1 Tax=Undibacterium sp. TJN19 TaxID=3413055 RepID=UPI003BF15A72